MEPYPHGWDVRSNGIKAFMAEKGHSRADLHFRRGFDAPQYLEHLGIETVLVDPERTFMNIAGQTAKIRFVTGNIFLPK